MVGAVGLPSASRYRDAAMGDRLRQFRPAPEGVRRDESRGGAAFDRCAPFTCRDDGWLTLPSGLSPGDKTPSEVGLWRTSLSWGFARTFHITNSATSSPRRKINDPLRGECEKSNALPGHALPA